MTDRRRHEIPLAGGNMNTVVRLGDTVRKTAHPWTASGHALLDHVRRAGFDRCPRPLGFDQDGREVLEYLPGDTWPNLPAELVWSKGALVSAGQMLARFHAAQVGFIPPRGSIWSEVARGQTAPEIICHNDWAPYNFVFRDRAPFAVIDFDVACPGSRDWDLAYAAFAWVPLCDPADVGGIAPDALDQSSRLRAFCDAYGGPDDHAGFVPLIIERLKVLMAWRVRSIEAGDPGVANTVEHSQYYERALIFLSDHLRDLRAVL